MTARAGGPSGRGRRALPGASVLGGALLVGTGVVAALLAGDPDAGAPRAPASHQRPPNVLLISIDTLRADHLGAYGYAPPTSPRVDAFAAGAWLFENAIAHAPSTEPSHASIFTSLLPVRHGALRARRQGISTGATTMAELFRRAGYRTISFNGGGQVAAAFGFDRGFERYESSSDDFEGQVGAAIGWLRGRGDEPFFMFLHTYEVHAPYAAAPRYLELFDAGYEGPLPDEITPRLILEIGAGEVRLDDADLGHVVAAYDAQIRSVDDAFGTLLDFLVASGLDAETIVLFTSDHGEELGEHGRVGEHTLGLHDEVLRVPLILGLPGRHSGGARVSTQVRGIDILPTLLDLAALPLPAGLEGTSLLPLVEGREERGVRLAVSQVDSPGRVPPSALRTGVEKLIVAPADLVDSPSFEWFAERAEVWAEGPLVQIPIEAHRLPRRLRIRVDGEEASERTIEPRLQIVDVRSRRQGRLRITLEATTPCTPAPESADSAEPSCASFRIFNPHAFYRLDEDPGERVDLAGEPTHRERIRVLRDRLRELTAPPASEPGTPARLDRETVEQLRALGYLR